MVVKKNVSPSPKPTVGRIVHFHTEGKQALAAIVTKVKEGDKVNLVVFADNEHNPLGYPTFLLQDIEHGKGKGQWDWPARDGE